MKKTFQFLENSIEGVAASNASGKIVFWNKALENITGLKKDEVIDKNFWDIQGQILCQEDQNLFGDKIKLLWESGAIVDLALSHEQQFQEFLLKKIDNTVIPVEQSFYIFRESKKTFYIISFIRDISKHKREQEVFEKYMNALIHDLRSPLVVLIGYSGLLLDEDFSLEETKELSKTINDYGKKMLKMMETYLLLKKIEQGQCGLEKKDKTIFEIIDEIKKAFSELSDKKKVRVILRNPKNNFLDQSLIQKKVKVNEILLNSLLTNLLRNAIEASPGADNDIVVNIYEEDGFCLSIFNPEKIPEENQKKLFQKFSTSKKNGSGLGLYSAKLITQAHNGTLSYQALVDGTRFIVKIPFN